jgi:rare lipoprotein A
MDLDIGLEYILRQMRAAKGVTKRTPSKINASDSQGSKMDTHWGLLSNTTRAFQGLFQGALNRQTELQRAILDASAKSRAKRQQQPQGSPPSERSEDRFFEYTIKRGDTLWALAVKRFHVHVEDLIRDNGIKDPRKIQPGQKIRIRRPSHPQEKQDVVASWYGSAYHGRTMANGEPFNMHAATIAHKELPFGTRVEIQNPETGVRVRAVVTDRGPYVVGRDVDLSYGLAKKLSMVEKGVGKLTMRVLG